jgi:hypothetical protein
VYAAALVRAILAGDGQAEEYFEDDGKRVYREPTMSIASIAGSGRTEAPSIGEISRVEDGDPTIVVTDTVELTVLRRIGDTAASGPALTGTWDGETRVLSYASNL